MSNLDAVAVLALFTIILAAALWVWREQREWRRTRDPVEFLRNVEKMRKRRAF